MGTRVLVILSAAIIAAMAAASMWAWYVAPEISRIAVHWNFSGEAVAFRSKEVALALAPLGAIGFSAFMSLLAATADDPGAKRYRAVWTAGLLALALVHAFFAAAAAGLITQFGNYTALGPALFIGVMGNYMAKGGAAGQRWTGRLFVLTSLATFATWILVPGAAAELVFAVGTVASMLIGALSKRRNDALGNDA